MGGVCPCQSSVVYQWVEPVPVSHLPYISGWRLYRSVICCISGVEPIPVNHLPYVLVWSFFTCQLSDVCTCVELVPVNYLLFVYGWSLYLSIICCMSLCGTRTCRLSAVCLWVELLPVDYVLYVHWWSFYLSVFCCMTVGKVCSCQLSIMYVSGWILYLSITDVSQYMKVAPVTYVLCVLYPSIHQRRGACRADSVRGDAGCRGTSFWRLAGRGAGGNDGEDQPARPAANVLQWGTENTHPLS